MSGLNAALMRRRMVLAAPALILGTQAAHAQPVPLRLAHVAPGRSDYQSAAERLAAAGAEAAQVTILPGGTMGDLTQLWAQLRTGAIDLHLIDIGGLVALREGRHFGVLLVPYLFGDKAHWDRFIASDLLREMMQPVEQAAGIRFVGYLGARPPRALSTTRRAVNAPADLQGLKLRTAEMPAVVEAFRRWGASPTPLRAPEVYNALQTGLVDGQDNGVTDTVSAGYADIQRHFAALDYLQSGMGVWASLPAWNRLGAARQDALRRAAAAAAAETDAALEGQVREAYASLAAKGVAVTRPDPAPFRAALEPWVAEADGRNWPAGLHARIAAL